MPNDLYTMIKRMEATVAKEATIGVPVALDGGAATVAGMLIKMADDNGGADFNAATDSLHEIGAGGTALVLASLNEIKNKAGVAGYDRTTDSLEALGEKTALIPGLF